MQVFGLFFLRRAEKNFARGPGSGLFECLGGLLPSLHGLVEPGFEAAVLFVERGVGGARYGHAGTGLLKIRGRIKEIIVTSTGEKVPPVDLELALETDPLFAQTFVVGEARPFISFVAVLNIEEWKKLATKLDVDPNDKLALQSTAVRSAVLKRARAAAAGFPHYALPRNVALTLEPWTIDNGLLTPTLKLKRKPLTDRFAAQIEEMYLSHARA